MVDDFVVVDVLKSNNLSDNCKVEVSDQQQPQLFKIEDDDQTQ